MANFRLDPAEGFETVVWTDPTQGVLTGRIGEVPNLPHRRLRKLEQYLEVHAVLDGEEEPREDADLDGRTFRAWWGEAPDGGPAIRTAVASSSVIRTRPTANGHYALVVVRTGSGGVILHFDVEPLPPAVS